MNQLIVTLLIACLIATILAIIALFYIIAASRRRAITLKKVDYLVEDLTYKSEMLNPAVETMAKVANYVDIFEAVARKNMKSATRVIARNKDDIYKVIDRIKKSLAGAGDDENQKGGK